MSPLDPVDARALHAEVPVIDLHADTPKLMSELGYDIMSRHERRLPALLNYAGHLDVPRMREGGLGAQIFGMWTVPYPERGCAAGIHKQLDALDAAVAANPETLALCASRADIEEAHRAQKIACLTGIEGAQALEGEIGHIEVFARRGVRYLGLMHFTKNPFGYPAKGLGADADRGLTELGRAAVAELDRVGVVLDLAHINRAGFFDAIEVSTRPMMVTHTGIAGVHEHWRNIDDEQIRAVADRGGCVGVIFARRFLGGKDIDAVCDHLLHIIDVAGEDVPALGSDFDGFVIPPVGLEDVSCLPRLTAALSARGMSDGALRKLLSGNALRVLGEVEPTAFRESRAS
jgi:membrane dipeptidase